MMRSRGALSDIGQLSLVRNCCALNIASISVGKGKVRPAV
jgi:hypothetical protein